MTCQHIFGLLDSQNCERIHFGVPPLLRMDKNQPANAGDNWIRSTASGKIPHALQQLSPCPQLLSPSSIQSPEVATTEPTCPEPVLHEAAVKRCTLQWVTPSPHLAEKVHTQQQDYLQPKRNKQKEYISVCHLAAQELQYFVLATLTLAMVILAVKIGVPWTRLLDSDGNFKQAYNRLSSRRSWCFMEPSVLPARFSFRHSEY